MKSNEVVNRSKISSGLGKALGVLSFMKENGDVPNKATYEMMVEMLESALDKIDSGLYGEIYKAGE